MKPQIKLVFSKGAQPHSRGLSKMSKKSPHVSLSPPLAQRMRSLLKKLETVLSARPELIPSVEGVVDELILSSQILPKAT